MMTREEFEAYRQEKAAEMAGDKELHGKVIDILTHSDHYNWFRGYSPTSKVGAITD